MNKNNVIFILFVATLLGSTWGAIVNRQKIDLEQQLRDAQLESQKFGGKPGKMLERMQDRTAGNQDILADKDKQLAGARKELATLRNVTQALKIKLAACKASIQYPAPNKGILGQPLKPGRDEVEGFGPEPGEKGAAAGPEGGALQGQARNAGLSVERLQQRLDETSAQVLGLEKIVDEKSAALRESAAEKERLRINMDVLLNKIADQQRELQAIQEENRELVAQLASRNEMADLQEPRHPVKK